MLLHDMGMADQCKITTLGISAFKHAFRHRGLYLHLLFGHTACNGSLSTIIIIIIIIITNKLGHLLTYYPQ
jgi:hypothetical protein